MKISIPKVIVPIARYKYSKHKPNRTNNTNFLNNYLLF